MALKRQIQYLLLLIRAVRMNRRSNGIKFVDPDSEPPGASTSKYSRISGFDLGHLDGSFGLTNGKSKLQCLRSIHDFGSWSLGGIMTSAKDQVTDVGPCVISGLPSGVAWLSFRGEAPGSARGCSSLTPLSSRLIPSSSRFNDFSIATTCECSVSE